MYMIEQFLVQNKEDSPSYYLGNDLKMKGDWLHISNKKYIKEVLRKNQEEQQKLPKKNTQQCHQMHTLNWIHLISCGQSRNKTLPENHWDWAVVSCCRKI
jgi:hypothetical protein